MILVNTDYITGKEFEMMGARQGQYVIQSKECGPGYHSGVKDPLVGGELKAYNEMMMERVIWRRNGKGGRGSRADAVVNIRYVSASVMQGRSGSSRLWYSSEIHLITGAVRFLKTKSRRNILILSFPALSGRLFFCFLLQ